MLLTNVLARVYCTSPSSRSMRLFTHSRFRFIVYPRPRIARKDQLAFKVKSVLKGTEHEGAKTFLVCRLVAHIFVLVARHELVSFLHQQIAEQKRIDASFSGVPLIEEGSSSLAAPKDVANPVDVQLVLPGDAKKQRKQTKQILLDKGEPDLFYVVKYSTTLSFRIWCESQEGLFAWGCACNCGGCATCNI